MPATYVNEALQKLGMPLIQKKKMANQRCKYLKRYIGVASFGLISLTDEEMGTKIKNPDGT